MFAKFLGESKTFFDVKDSEPIVAFLNIKRKSKEEDPEQKWITTWNDYLWRLKMFYRWLYNVQLKGDNYMFSILIYPWVKIWHNAYTKKVFINLIDTLREGEIGQSYTCKDTNT